MEINITLVSILVIVLLFIPGFFFKRFYYSGQFTKQFHAGTFAERFITSIFWGLIVQCITVAIFGQFSDAKYDDVRVPITSIYGDLSKDTLPMCTSAHFNYGIGYILSTIIIASILGLISHFLVRQLRLDVMIPVLRFANHWNYYFKGDLRTLRGNSRRGKVISTNIDVIVDDGSDSNRLITGFLAHYTISPTTGELETIALAQPEKWSDSTKAFKPIQSDNLIIPYSTVKNLNIRYNIKIRSWKEIADATISITALILFIFILFAIPLIYYKTIGLLMTITATVVGLADALFGLTLVAFLIVPPPPGKDESGEVSKRGNIAAIVMLTLLVIGLTWILNKILT